ncbi:MAG: tetratricopeptide repeat protein [Methanobrevibacter sp.]|nr:tetratricopeptide repeat protein [Methanobrevibacter sp.]
MFKFINKLRMMSKIKRGFGNYIGGDFEKALKYYDEVLKIEPNCKYALTYKAMVLADLGEFNNALKYYDKSINSNPHYIDTWRYKIELILNEFNYSFALETVNKGLELNNDNLDLLNLKISILVECKKFKHALKIANYGLKIHPKSEASGYMKAMVLDRMGCIEKSIHCFDKLTKSYPYFPDGWFGLAVENNKLNNSDLAIKFIEKAISIKYVEEYVYLYIIILVEKLEDYDKGLEVINELLESRKYPFNEESYSTIYFLKGKIMDEKNEIDNAIENYETAIEIYKIIIRKYHDNLKNYGEIVNYNECYDDLDIWKENCLFAKNRLKKLKLS